MAETKLKDGTGDNILMKVDKDHRAHVQSLSISYEDFAVLQGESYGVLTPTTILNSGNYSYLMYLSNDNTHNIVISNIDAYIGENTTSSNLWSWDLYLAPTGGTLISGGTPAFVANNNLGSPNTLPIQALTGVEGSTVTGGISVQVPIMGEQIYKFTQKVVIPPGSTLALGFKPPTGNTSATCAFGVTLIRQNLDTV